ncbi:MAG TPA: hypothetical protein VE075_06930, partial [Thermoanaerobaculia bacterium]|nr:hypothetical protein [Thermoanaerobaculia bacterium]
MKRPRTLLTALPLGLLLLAGGLVGACASGGEDADSIKELQDRVLELQRKAAVAEVELARLRQEVADLLAKQGMGGSAFGSPPGPAAGGAGGGGGRAPVTPRGAAGRRPAAADGFGAAPARPPASADRVGAGGAAPVPAGGAGRGPAIDETDIDVPAPQPARPYQASPQASPPSPAPPGTAGSSRRPAAPLPAPAPA